jgi:hypothetical protein
MARRPLPRLVHSSRSRAEFRDAPLRRGAASQDAARSRRSRGSSGYQTPSTKLRRTPASVSSSPTSTSRAPEGASPLVAGLAEASAGAGPSTSIGGRMWGPGRNQCNWALVWRRRGQQERMGICAVLDLTRGSGTRGGWSSAIIAT